MQQQQRLERCCLLSSAASVERYVSTVETRQPLLETWLYSGEPFAAPVFPQSLRAFRVIVSVVGSGRLFAALVLGAVCIDADGQSPLLAVPLAEFYAILRSIEFCSEPVCHG